MKFIVSFQPHSTYLAKMRKKLLTIALILSVCLAIFPATSDARPPFILEQQPELQRALKGLISLYKTNRFFTSEEVEAMTGIHLTPVSCSNSGVLGPTDFPIKAYCEQKEISPHKNYSVGYFYGLNWDTPPQVVKVHSGISLEKLKPCLTLWELETVTQVRFKVAPPQRQPVPFIPPGAKNFQLETVYELLSDSNDYSRISFSVSPTNNCVKGIGTGKVNAEVQAKM